jgi:hypothetical protein
LFLSPLKENMMFRPTTLASLVAIALSATPIMAQAAKGKGSNADAAKATATSPAVQAVETVRTAEALAKYGDAKKDPMALIQAAKMKKEAGEQALTLTRKGAGEAGKKDAKAADYSVDGMLGRAKTLAAGRADLVALADDVSKSGARGAVGGPKSGRTVVKGGFTDQFVMKFEGGEPAAVQISGDGDSTLDLYVYDENGNRVCAAVGRGDDAVCRWNPKWTGPFTVRVVNRGVANEYSIRTN